MCLVGIKYCVNTIDILPIHDALYCKMRVVLVFDVRVIKVR